MKKFFKNYKEAKNIFYLSGISSPNFRENNHYINLLENIKYQNLLNRQKKINIKEEYFFFFNCYLRIKQNEAVEKYDNLKPGSLTLSKIVGELQSNFYSKNYNLNIINLRLCSIFGPTLKGKLFLKFLKKHKIKK